MEKASIGSSGVAVGSGVKVGAGKVMQAVRRTRLKAICTNRNMKVKGRKCIVTVSKNNYETLYAFIYTIKNAVGHPRKLTNSFLENL
jgi:hypothetical protein